MNNNNNNNNAGKEEVPKTEDKNGKRREEGDRCSSKGQLIKKQKLKTQDERKEDTTEKGKGKKRRVSAK